MRRALTIAAVALPAGWALGIAVCVWALLYGPDADILAHL